MSIIKVTTDSVSPGPDLLAIEEPLEIRVAYGDRVQNLAVTMRTPGDDADLALGFLFTEGIIKGGGDVQEVAPATLSCSENRQNTILVTLKEGIAPNLQRAERNFYTTSSCGVCGKASIDAIRTVSAFHAETRKAKDGSEVEGEHRGEESGGQESSEEGIDPVFILGLPERLVRAQAVFADTGGLHAAALFGKGGELLCIREDVGRHNAVDKLIGATLRGAGIPLSESVLLLSGRASFELVQKAAMAGIPVIAAMSAPSSLAVSLAEEFHITLIGFLRDNRFNIYSAAHRIEMPVHENTDV